MKTQKKMLPRQNQPKSVKLDFKEFIQKHTKLLMELAAIVNSGEVLAPFVEKASEQRTLLSSAIT